ncbi:hypothetical protein DE146DRAFT_738643 [Phaeosphaeria sp. MPI-PUGE-AT-0046c]|nr:hypothetical protein DE146DRAFT_738643 [Phaeosphaeria sp. MPI-PUGE-AT-0046c]
MAATRLRRTFHYPSESSDEDAIEQGMDEQDQTHLISTLAAHDASSTRTYTLLLSILPLAPALAHIPLLGRGTSFAPALLAVVSFFASAYALYFVPLPAVKVGIIQAGEEELKAGGMKKKKRGGAGGYGLGTVTDSMDAAVRERRPVPWVGDEVAEVLARYVVPANGVVCVFLAMLELWRGRGWGEGVSVGGGFLPGFVLSVVMWARRELRVMDMGELEKLKYGSKGM